MPKKIISITKARQKLFEIVEEVQKPNHYYTLTIDGEPKVVIMSYNEFNSMMETMDILSDPQAMTDIRQAEEDYKKGEFVTLEQLKNELVMKDAYVLADKSKKNYKVKSIKYAKRGKKK